MASRAVRKVKLENGEVLQVQKIDDEYFGEGIAVFRDRIFELTWRSGSASSTTGSRSRGSAHSRIG